MCRWRKRLNRIWKEDDTAMKMNPKILMQLKDLEERFKAGHPRLEPFFAAAAASVDEGSVIEVTMTTSAGETLRTNMRVSAQDMEMIRTLKESAG